MAKKLFPIVCIAFVMASASPASARLILPEQADFVVVLPHWEYADFTDDENLVCSGEEASYSESNFPYRQLMIVNGVRMMVPTDLAYTTGRKELSLSETCGASFVYGAGDCAC
jgi:hypothetical protein